MAKTNDRKAFNKRGRLYEDRFLTRIDRRIHGISASTTLGTGARWSAKEERIRELFRAKMQGGRR